MTSFTAFTKEQVLSEVAKDGLQLKNAYEAFYCNNKLSKPTMNYPEDYRGDNDVVLAAVKQNGLALQYADDALKNDKVIVFAAVAQDGKALQFATDDWNKDKTLVLLALETGYWGFLYADKALKEDFEVALATVKQHGMALQQLTPKLQSNEAIVKAAVWQNSNALRYASKDLQNNTQLRALQLVSCLNKVLKMALNITSSCKNMMIGAVVSLITAAALVFCHVPLVLSAGCAMALGACASGLGFFKPRQEPNTPADVKVTANKPVTV